MYKMYNVQWDTESNDEKDTLYSSFWSDGEMEDKDEGVEIMRVTDPRPVNDPECSKEERLELESQEVLNEGALEKENDDDRKATSSTSGSAAESPMTSGYGTYRSEEQNLADGRDDRSTIGFNRDSREDLSEFRDDDGDSRSLRSFTASEPTHGPDASELVACVSESRRGPAVASCCEDGRTLKEIRVVDTIQPVVTESASEGEFLHGDADETLLFHKKGFEDGTDGDEAEQEELRPKTEHISAVDVPDESSSSKDAASCLEERMAELDLASSDQNDYEADENDSQSSETDGVDLSAFESYIKGMTQYDREERPKPKSFIRPVCQRTIKKTDPVAKYFQYKEMWEMFQVPGEKDRKALRWEIKEKLSFQPLPPKPRRVYMPNTYIVPTEKKRSELRWTIRNDLANGRLPQKFNSQF